MDAGVLTKFPPLEDTRLEKDSRTGFWRISWTEREDGKRSRTRTWSCRTKDRREAEKVRIDWLTMGGRVLEEMGIPLVRDILDKYEELYLEAEKKTPTQRNSLKPVRAFLGDTLVTDLNVVTIGTYRRTRTSVGRTDGTIRRELLALTAALNWCRKNGVLLDAGFVVPDFSLPPESQPRKVFLEDKRERAVWDLAVADRDAGTGRMTRVGRFVCLALGAPARASTIESLTWDRVDLVNRVIDYRVPGKRVTSKRQVPLPISDRLFPVLVHAKLEAVSEYVLDHPGSVRKSWETFREKHGLEDVTRHDLRRTWASLNAMSGVSMFDIAGVLGDSVETAIKHYAHLSPDHLRGAVNARK
jgi:integrase